MWPAEGNLRRHALVKAAVAGDLGSSRYTRIALIGSRCLNRGLVPRLCLAERPQRVIASGSQGDLWRLNADRHGWFVELDDAEGAALEYSPRRGRQRWRVGSVRLVKWIAKFNPDVVSLNEMERKTSWSKNTDEPVTIASLMQQYTGKPGIGNSRRCPARRTVSATWCCRGFRSRPSGPLLLSGGRSAINIELTVNGRTINFTSTHLHPDSASYRMTEIGELTSWERGMAEQRIIAGDFNASYTSTEDATMTKTYYDSWAEAQADGTAVAYAGNTAGNTRNGRIDFIYYSRTATNLVLKSSQVYDTRDANGVMPSDHRPVMSVFTVK